MESHQQEDPLYLLSRDFKDHYDSQCYREEINDNGWVFVGNPSNWAKVYNGMLAAFLNADEVSVTKDTEKIEVNWVENKVLENGSIEYSPDVKTTGEKYTTTICGENYLDSYLTGYANGINWFKNEYGLNNETLYSQSEKYKADLHQLYFHSNWGYGPTGLAGYNKVLLFNITHKNIEEKGYYAGISSSIERVVSKHPHLFSDFADCQAKEQSAQLASSSKPPSSKARVLIHCYKQLPPISRGEVGYNYYLAFMTPRKRIAYPKESKIVAENLISLIEEILPELNNSQRQQAESEIQTIRANFS